MVERLSNGIVVVSANAEKVLLEAFVEGVKDGVGRGQFEKRMGDENYRGIVEGVLYNWSSSRSGVGKIEVC